MPPDTTPPVITAINGAADVPRSGIPAQDTCLSVSGDNIVGQTNLSLMPCDLSTGQIIDFIPGKVDVAVTPSCQEDDPCWDCHTMGDHVCGPNLTTSTIVSLPATGVRDMTPETVAGGALLALGVAFVAIQRWWRVAR